MTQPEAPFRAPAQPSLQDCICLLYEHSLVPVREIARLAGLTERNVYATVRRRGCRPRVHVGEGGGRRIVMPANEAAPPTLDIEAARRAIVACAQARQRALDAAAERAAARSARVARRQAIRESEKEARTLSVIAGTLRHLAIVERNAGMNGEGAAAGARRKRGTRHAAEQPARDVERMRVDLAQKLEAMVQAWQEEDAAVATTFQRMRPGRG
jgi:hypothetical protein